MKKQALTKQDIQEALLIKLNKRKSTSLFLTAVVIIGIILYPIHLINYLNNTPFDYTGGFPNLAPTTALFIMPLLIIFCAVIVFYLYYSDLYKIKKGNFEIIEDNVCQKRKEWRHYNRYSQKENSLYFRCGRVAVNDSVYSYSDVGDTFYVIILKSKAKKTPQLAYHTKYYEINVD